MTLRHGFLVPALSLALVAVATAAPAPDVKTDPHESLEKLIPECIRLLEAKEYVKLIECMASPEQVAKAKTMEGGIEELAKTFGRNKAETLLQVLKKIKTEKPMLNDDGTIATYKVEIPGAPPEISFRRIEKHWYLNGK